MLPSGRTLCSIPMARSALVWASRRDELVKPLISSWSRNMLVIICRSTRRHLSPGTRVAVVVRIAAFAGV